MSTEQTVTDNSLNAPAWDVESVYPSLQSEAFVADRRFVDEFVTSIESLTKKIECEPANTVRVAQEALIQFEKASVLLSTIRVYVSCLSSIDATDNEAQAAHSQIEVLASRLQQAIVPAHIFAQTCGDATFDQLLAHAELKGAEFELKRIRSLAPFALPSAEEALLMAMEVSGHHAWANLYSNLTGTAKCHLRYDDRIETVGFAEAQALLYGNDSAARKAAWLALQEFCTEHRETFAAIVNALAAWRLELCRRRSTKKSRDFLDSPLFENRVSKETVEAIFQALWINNSQLRRGPELMARVFGKKQLEQWDLLCPSPVAAESRARTFDEGVEIVKAGFRTIDPSMADFVDMMVKNKWIDARVLPNKMGGAYCTYFDKVQQPRVFQTYMGSLPDIMTLAHELGHAYHSWMMRTLPYPEQNYAKTLAETASVFAETAIRDHLFSKAKSKEEKIEFGWTDLETLTGYLINIPVRFEFERDFYEKRKASLVSADELEAMMDAAWAKWYGPTITRTDKLFWAHKGHFSISETSFYNFPYAFGFLFSLSVYSRKSEFGSNFMQTYNNLLQDTGRMTAEDLVQKHLGEDIRDPKFWQKAIDTVIGQIDRFEKVLG